MAALRVPQWVRDIQQQPLRLSDYSPTELDALRAKLKRLAHPDPLVSVVIPAWNEAEGILHTLHSLANTTTDLPTELIVVDNNSTDDTAGVLAALGVRCVLETKQGVGHARTCGLYQAKGRYLLSADSDTLYPPGWISAMAKTMIKGQHEPVFCVHGSYAFLPGSTTPRWQYALYEMLSAIIKRRKEKTQPFLNALGFNFGFVREKGIAVNGYDIATQRIFRGAAGVVEDNATEDGMMALRLMEAGGTIQPVRGASACVWTSDRRIQLDGGLVAALLMRVKKHLRRPQPSTVAIDSKA